MESTSEQTLQQLMFSLIEIWKTSGKSQQAFCREKELDYFKFQYWFRKYRRSNSEADPSTERPGFSRIKVKETEVSRSSSGLLEIIFPNGQRLIFHQPVEASFVRILLA